MITQQILNEILALFITKDNKVTIEDLKEKGLDSNLSELLRLKKIIYQKPNDTYRFVDMMDLYQYVCELYNLQKYQEAIKASEIYLKMRPNDNTIRIKLLNSYIVDSQYEKAYAHFTILEKLNPNFFAQNANLFRLLFSKLITLPSEEVAKVKALFLEDTLIPNPQSNENIEKDNEILKKLFQSCYLAARAELQKKVYKNEAFVSLFDWILYRFSSALVAKQTEEIEYILAKAKEGDYHSILNFYNDLEQKTTLSIHQKALYLVAKDLVALLNGQELLPPVPYGKNNAYNAIFNRQYARALSILEQKKSAYHNAGSALYILLNKICEVLKEKDSQKEKDYKEKLDCLNQQIEREKIVIWEENDNNFLQYAKQDLSNNKKLWVDVIWQKGLIVRKRLYNADVISLLASAKQKYENHDLKNAIALYQKALMGSKILNLDVVVNMALCYFQLGQKDEAILYFDLASDICRIRQKENPYQAMALMLKTGSYVGQMQNIFALGEKQFNSPLYLNSVIKFMEEQNVNLLDALLMLNLSEIEKNYLLLFYTYEAIKKGDNKYAGELLENVKLRDPNAIFANEINYLASFLENPSRK